MMRIARIVMFITLLFMFVFEVSAEGTWTTFTNGNYVMKVEVHGNYVWCGTMGGVVRWDTSDMSWVKYTIDDGLTNNWILSLEVSSDGTVWAGTHKGLSRFDGKSWLRFTEQDGILNNYIPSLAVDSHNTIWVGSVGGLNWYDSSVWKTLRTAEEYIFFLDVMTGDPTPVNNQLPFAKVNEPYHATIPLPYPAKPVSGYELLESPAWLELDSTSGMFSGVPVATDAGIGFMVKIRINYTDNLPKDFERTDIVCISIAPEGDLWCGTDRKGLLHFDGEFWTVYTTENGLAENEIQSLGIDPYGNVWVGTATKGLCRFDGYTWKTYNDAYGLPHGSIKAIDFDPDGNIMFSTLHGIIHYTAGEWKAIGPESGNGSYDLAISDDGSVWSGNALGLCRYDKENWTLNTTDDGPVNNEINTVAVDPDGNIWCGSYGGLSRYDGSQWKIYTYDDILWSYEITSLAFAPDGVLWFGTRGGVGRYNGETWTYYTVEDGIPDQNIISVAIGANGDVWCGTLRKGVCRFDGEVWKTYNAEDGLAGNKIRAIAIGMDGDVWCGTSIEHCRAALSRFNGKTWTTYETRGCRVDTIEIGPDSDVWIGSDEGIGRFNGESWKYYNEDDGLVSKNVQSIDISSDGTAWIGTYRGVSCYDGVKWRSYTTDDGLTNNNINSVAIAPDGAIWFGCNRGGLSRLIEELPTIVGASYTLPQKITITGNYPNPFNHSTTIGFVLPHEDLVNLSIYNIMGQKVRTLLSETKTAGTHSIIWDGRDEKGSIVSSGIYLTHLNAGLNSISRRMLLLK